MSTIKIKLLEDPEIFDDPIYCEKKENDPKYEKCEFLNTDQGICEITKTGHGLSSELGNIEQFKKHQECKEAWRKAKEAEPEKEEKPVENDSSLPIIDWDEFDKFYNEKCLRKPQQ